MIRVQPEPWATMVAHAQATYPNECCGVMLGSIDDDKKVVEVAINLENAYSGPQNEHYEVRPEDLLMADREARKLGMDVIGIFILIRTATLIFRKPTWKTRVLGTVSSF